MSEWAFSKLGLQLAMQAHFGALVSTERLSRDEAKVAASLVLGFLEGPAAAILRLDPVSAAARAFARAARRGDGTAAATEAAQGAGAAAGAGGAPAPGGSG